MKALALAAIRFYQQYISPRKGFCCAYAAYTSDASCSALGYRTIRRFGVWIGLAVLDRRLARCGTAHRIANNTRPPPVQAQAGYLDCGGCDAGGCDGIGCDTPGGGSSWWCRGLGGAVDACSGCGCDWPTRRGSAKGYRKGSPDNEEAVKRRSRLLRKAHATGKRPVK